MSRRRVGWHRRPFVFAGVMFFFGWFGWTGFWTTIGILAMLLGTVRILLNPEEDR